MRSGKTVNGVTTGHLWDGTNGEYFDAETGFIYLRARYMNPETGRFISEDPVSDGVNWYAYAAGNPVRFYDPSGLAGFIFGEDGSCSYYNSDSESWEIHDASGNITNKAGDIDGIYQATYILISCDFISLELNDLTAGVIKAGSRENEIVILPIASTSDFKKSWNSMGKTVDAYGNIIDVDIKNVIIDMHGGPMSVGLSNGDTLFVNGMSDLKEKSISGSLLLAACNTGYSEENIACFFAKLVGTANVFASDSTVYRIKKTSKGNYHFTTKQKEFNSVFTQTYPYKGWIKYSYKNGVISRQILNKSILDLDTCL